MMEEVVTCKNATMYPGMLTRGKEYTFLEVDDNKGMIKLVCDNGRTRLFPIGDFNLDGQAVPMLISWKFDDNPKKTKRTDFLSWVEVTIELSNGTKRWCKLYTPDLLYKVLNQDNVNPPGFFMKKFIAVRSLGYNDVDKVIKYLDDNDELIEASLPIDSDDLGPEEE